jgi:hypothetical protein
VGTRVDAATHGSSAHAACVRSTSRMSDPTCCRASCV